MRSISTVIPTLDEAAVLGAALDAVTRQLESFGALGGFAPWPLMEDLDLCRRLRRGRFRVLRAVETSARRWLAGGVVRTQLAMWGCRAAFALGVPPEALGRRHAAVR
jgi:hypothetical protein